MQATRQEINIPSSYRCQELTSFHCTLQFIPYEQFYFNECSVMSR
jgi:hypothetical protein